MPLARREFTVVDEHGDIVTDAQVEVRSEIAGQPLVSLFSDRDGAVPIGNPFSVDPTTAVAAFHVVGGAYRVRAFAGAFERIERHVPIGTAAETDAGLIPTSISTGWLFDDATADADPGSGEFRLNHATPSSATAVYIDNENAGANSVTTWLDSLDDAGDSSIRGQLTICDPDQPTEVFRIYTVSGSVVDGTGYRKLTVAHLSGAGSLTEGTQYSFSFDSRGPQGVQGIQGIQGIQGEQGIQGPQGDPGSVSGPVSSVSGNAAIFGDTSGDVLADAGAPPLLHGRHTIWVPATAMYTRTTNGAASGTTEMGTNRNMFKTFDFDTTTQEFVQFEVAFPKSWNEGTITFQPVLSHASGSGNVVFGLAGVARSNDDAGDVAFGTAQTSDRTVGTANDIYIGPESSAITIAGSPAAGDTVQFQVNRTVASDSLGVDARLHGVIIYFTVNAGNDT